MSKLGTSCIIAFTDGQKTVSTYKHFDGNEEHTIPMLAKFLKWNTRDDLEYSIPNWFYFAKLEDRNHYAFISQDETKEEFKKSMDDWDNRSAKLGYGLELENYEADYIVNVVDKTINGRGVIN